MSVFRHAERTVTRRKALRLLVTALSLAMLIFAGAPPGPLPGHAFGDPARDFQDTVILQPSTAGPLPAVTISFTPGDCRYAVNDAVYTMAAAPFIDGGRTYLPVRYAAQALGMSEADIGWDPAARAAFFRYAGHLVTFTAGCRDYTVDGSVYAMDARPEMTGGFMYVPVRYLASAFGYSVAWRQQAQPAPPAGQPVVHPPPGARGLYILVDTAIPEHLYVCQDASVILETYCNTGVPAAPTPTGTFRIFAKMPSDDMTGTNPDGSRYFDRDVPWVMYFYGGCAIHGFVRARYGYPQSVGCVELPVAAAKQVYNMVPVGTKVYIE